MTAKTLAALIDRADPALPLIDEWIEDAPHPVERLARADADAERVLLAMQVTTRSTLGAVAYETGGLLVDHRWLRVLGAGSERLPRDLAGWNGLPGRPRIPGALLVGDDAVGGFFAVNGGAFEGPQGNVFYFAPETQAWEDTEKGYTDWLAWAIGGDLALFYETSRWPGWEDEVAAIPGDRALSIVPPLWTEGGPIAERSRRAVPLDELFALQLRE